MFIGHEHLWKGLVWKLYPVMAGCTLHWTLSFLLYYKWNGLFSVSFIPDIIWSVVRMDKGLGIGVWKTDLKHLKIFLILSKINIYYFKHNCIDGSTIFYRLLWCVHSLTSGNPTQHQQSWLILMAHQCSLLFQQRSILLCVAARVSTGK